MTEERYVESHVLTLVKEAGRKLSDRSNRTALESIVAGSLTRQRAARGWSITINDRPIDPQNEYDTMRIEPANPDRTFYDVNYVADSAHDGHLQYRAHLAIKLDTDRARDSKDAELHGLIKTIAARAAGLSGLNKWEVERLDGNPYSVKPSEIAEVGITSVVTGGTAHLDAADAIGYAPCAVPENWDAYFSHLFGIEDQIGLVKSPLVRALSTGWAKRFHTKLIGPPGCGKSALLRAMKNAVGEESVMEFDATATTAAGAMEMLSEFEELPRIMIVEEIEKAPTDTFQFLLGLMDDRAEVRKVTARKKIMRETRLLVFATVNDEDILDRAMGGALSSRFSNPIYFNRPSRDLMAKILMREVEMFGGDPAWVPYTLDLAEVLDESDPRRIISMMMLGGNDLLSGEYQRRMLNVGMPRKMADPETLDMVKSKLDRLVREIQSESKGAVA